MLHDNLLLNTDSYKASHYKQYPPDATHVSSYIESRYSERGWDSSMFFGLQMFLKQYLAKPITLEMIDEAEEFWAAHGEPFNRDGWMYILKEHGGRLPVEIQAVPEGTVMPLKNVMVQMINTDPKVPWLTNFLETAVVRAVWFPVTVATNDWYIKRIIKEFLDKTAMDTAGQIGFKLHDFGARGVSSMESAGIGGCAHLVNFLGTDTVTGALYARRFYGENMAGFSIPAAEHSTITCWGGPKMEIEAFRNMLKQYAKPGALVAVVSDSYDIYAACDKWLELRQEIIDSGATLVVRPDSGDPVQVVSNVIEKLMKNFGEFTNDKGYRVLPNREDGSPIIRVIQGDGINHESIREILTEMESRKLSAENIAFGMGGGMLQDLTRDTLGFAMKASAVKRKGLWQDVYKDPITDSGKKSKRGRLALTCENGVFETVPAGDVDLHKNLLQVVYRNGQLSNTQSFAEIRERAGESLLGVV